MNAEWLQRHCRRMFLRGLQVQAWIGIHPFELAAPQRLLLDIDVYVALEDSSPQSDAIDEVVDYDFVRERVHARVQAGPIRLQETLVDGLLDDLLSHPMVQAARVASCKPDVYPDCAGVGVEAFRFRERAA